MKIIASLVLFLIKYWKVGAIIGVILSIWYPIHKLQQENISLKKDKVSISRRLEKCQSDAIIFKENETVLKNTIKDQNDKIDQLGKFAKEQEAKAKIEIEESNLRAKNNTQTANNILVAVPKSTDVCKAADILINEQLQ